MSATPPFSARPSAQVDMRSALQSALAWWDDSGVDCPPIPAAPRKARARTPVASSQPQQQNRAERSRVKPTLKPAASVAPQDTRASDAAKLIASASAIAGAAPTLDALTDAIAQFDAGDLSANASQAVFSRGNRAADIMIIGDAPTRDDDKAGAPFTGKPGALLERMLGAIGRGPDALYITTVCNWRPLNSHTPSPEAIALARPFITRHIELISPKVIVLMGSVALECITGEKGITKLRGQWQSVTVKGAGDIAAMPMYHPDFLMKRPELKAEAWRDLRAIKSRLEV